MSTWSWTALLRANGGDEDRALAALSRMTGTGEYTDEMHEPCGRSLRHPSFVGAPTCPAGHLMHRHGAGRWRCKPCRWTQGEVAAMAAGGG